MSKLLYAGARRYVKSAVFWLAFAATVISMIYLGQDSRNHCYVDEFVIFFEFLVMTIVTSWHVGQEHEEGIFRNKLVAGYGKGMIFLTEIILGVGICLFFFLIGTVIFACYNRYVFGVVPAHVLVRIFVDMLLINVCITIVCITISSLIRYKALSVIGCIVTLFALFFIGDEIYSALREPEYNEDWIEYSYYDEDGVEHEEILDLGKEENPEYVDGGLRTVYEFLDKVIPFNHVTDNLKILSGSFGYEYYLRVLESGEEVPDDMNPTKFFMDEEEEEILRVNWIYSFVLVVVVLFAGNYLFCRKDFL